MQHPTILLNITSGTGSPFINVRALLRGLCLLALGVLLSTMLGAPGAFAQEVHLALGTDTELSNINHAEGSISSPGLDICDKPEEEWDDFEEVYCRLYVKVEITTSFGNETVGFLGNVPNEEVPCVDPDQYPNPNECQAKEDRLGVLGGIRLGIPLTDRVRAEVLARAGISRSFERHLTLVDISSEMSGSYTAEPGLDPQLSFGGSLSYSLTNRLAVQAQLKSVHYYIGEQEYTLVSGSTPSVDFPTSLDVDSGWDQQWKVTLGLRIGL